MLPCFRFCRKTLGGVIFRPFPSRSSKGGEGFGWSQWQSGRKELRDLGLSHNIILTCWQWDCDTHSVFWKELGITAGEGWALLWSTPGSSQVGQCGVRDAVAWILCLNGPTHLPFGPFALCLLGILSGYTSLIWDILIQKRLQIRQSCFVSQL